MIKNKRFALLTVAILLTLTLALVGSALADKKNKTAMTATITETEARQAALDHSGLKETDVTFIKIELDKDDGRTVYEVEFYQGTSAYDYDVDAATGEIVAFKTETDFDTDGVSGATTDAATGAAIDEAAAKANALAHAGFAESDVTKFKIELDHDDGGLEYEIKFNANNMTYKYDVDAQTGKITSFKVEKE